MYLGAHILVCKDYLESDRVKENLIKDWESFLIFYMLSRSDKKYPGYNPNSRGIFLVLISFYNHYF